MWQKLVLTAGTETQNLIFREQLSHIPTDEYCETVEVVTDESPGIRIGSGGATLSIIRRLLQQDGEKGKVHLNRQLNRNSKVLNSSDSTHPLGWTLSENAAFVGVRKSFRNASEWKDAPGDKTADL